MTFPCCIIFETLYGARRLHLGILTSIMVQHKEVIL